MKNTKNIFTFFAFALITSVLLSLAAAADVANQRRAIQEGEWSFALLNAADRIKAEPSVAEGAIARFVFHYAPCSRSLPPAVEAECVITASSALKRERKHNTLPSRLEEESELVLALMASIASTQEEPTDKAGGLFQL